MKIAQQVEVRMRAKHISIPELESQVGLKTHAVRNILRGKSKNPSAVNLQAIADVLGCSVKDLLETPEVLEEGPRTASLEKVLQATYSKYDKNHLLPEVVKTVETLAQKQKNDFNVEQFLTSVREIYLHSLQKDPTKVDVDFAEWFMGIMTE